MYRLEPCLFQIHSNYSRQAFTKLWLSWLSNHKKNSTGLDLTFEQILTGILLDKDKNHEVILFAILIYK